IIVPGHTPFGAVVDPTNGMLWSASYGETLLGIDTRTGQVTPLYWHGNYVSHNYGIAIGNGKVYLGSASGPYFYIQFDPTMGSFNIPAYVRYANDGIYVTSDVIAVDSKGNIIVVDQPTGLLYKFSPDNQLIWVRDADNNPNFQQSGWVGAIV